MLSVQIVEVPPGFAPEEIRQQWVGIILDAFTQDEIRYRRRMRYGVDNANVGGFIVSRLAAVAALKLMGRREAADFWTGFSFGRYLQFRKDVCQIVVCKTLDTRVNKTAGQNVRR